MIPKTFYDDQKEDRRVIDDYWSWLKDQPQDAWLLWARWANWDNAESLFERMLDRPDCDLALVSWIFWGCDPAHYVRNPARHSATSMIAKIAGNCERGFYTSAQLFCDRYEVAINAHEYAKALLETSPAQPPFALPRQLCGPFEGRKASLPERYDDETEAGLAEVFAMLDGGLPRSEAVHWRNQESGGNLWLMARMKLPSVPANPVAAYARLSDADYVQAIFGRSAAYTKARTNTAPRKKWWPFG